MSLMITAEYNIGQVMSVQLIHMGPEWIESISCRCTHQVIIPLGREYREWCDGMAELTVLQLIDDNISEGDAVVYTGHSMHCEDQSGWGLSARIRSMVVAEQSGAYRPQV